MSPQHSHPAGLRRTRNASGTKSKRQPGQDTEKFVVRVAASEWHAPQLLREKFLDVSVAGQDLTVDLSEMQHLDTGALQVLLALHREKQSEGAPLRLHAVSSDTHRWLTYAGAASIFLSTSETE